MFEDFRRGVMQKYYFPAKNLCLYQNVTDASTKILTLYTKTMYGTLLYGSGFSFFTDTNNITHHVVHKWAQSHRRKREASKTGTI